MSAYSSPYGGSNAFSRFAGSEQAQEPPRKKMRKGTKSCIECRRRKIKCTFEPGKTAICNECSARGSTCIDQEHGDVQPSISTSTSNESSLKDRVAGLEDMIREILNRLPVRNDTQQTTTQSSHVDTQAAEVLKSFRTPIEPTRSNIDDAIYLSHGPKEEVPILSLFDNAVLSTKEIPRTVSREQYNKAKTIISHLLQSLISISDLEKILLSSQEWWSLWKTMIPEMTDRRCITIQESISHTLRSEKPAEIGKIMLCLALSINQLPPDFDWDSLSTKESPNDLMEQYVMLVDRWVVSDEEIAATIGGIECTVLMAKLQINKGKPRKGWLLYKKAIAFAQLLGLHRLAVRKPRDNDHQYARRLTLWCHLLMGDRYLALALGLPYSVGEAFCGPALSAAKALAAKIGQSETFIYDILPIVTKIVDRNQNQTCPYSVTMDIEHEMESLRRKYSPEWWTTERFPKTTVEEYFERLQAQFFFHHTRNLLHMPYMLRCTTDKRYQYSYTATLEASREIIKYYEALRTSEDAGPHACKMVDFQAFSAAMLLLLNLIGYSYQNRGSKPQHSSELVQDQRDSILIDHVVRLLKEAANEPGGGVAANSAQALELLAKSRHGSENGGGRPEPCQVSIPYFGTITIAPGKNFVPIKPGTYPRAENSGTETRPRPSMAGLPTPPSMPSQSSQASPMDMPLEPRQSPYWNNAENRTRGMNQQWRGHTEDPFVTFDSFMAFPSANKIDFTDTNLGLGGSSTDEFSDRTMLPQSAFNGLGSMEEQNMAAGFPFPLANGGNVDLDAGWSWFGVGAPSM